MVLPYINMHPPRVYMCSPSWTPLPPYHTSGSSQCPSPKLPVFCIEPGLAIRFLYDIIHVLMPFSQIIPLSLSHRVQKTVLYICVSFAVSHTGLSLHLSKFHIYALVYCIGFFFLAYFTLYNRLQFHPPHWNWFKCILFNGWVILHCVYVPQLSYLFICWWTSRLFPCPGYCKQCCDEHRGTRVSFNSGFLGVYAQQWDCWVIWQFYFHFLKEFPHCSP